jgi:dTDP-4-amino-4,6-dideoxygalactose transaminase
MTDIAAALGLSQLARLDSLVQSRRAIAQRYDEVFDTLPIVTPWQLPSIRSSYHLYPIRVRHADCGKTQRQVYDALRAAGIGTNLHYIPVHRQPYYERLGFKAGYCPQSEQFHREVISMPMYPSLTADQQEWVIEALRNTLLE